MARRKYKRRYTRRPRNSGINDGLFLGVIILLLVAGALQSISSSTSALNIPELSRYFGLIKLVFQLALLAFGFLVAFKFGRWCYRKYREFQEKQRELENYARKQEYARSIIDLHTMDPFDFEDYMIELYRKLGYEAQGTQRGKDGGIDGELRKDGKKYILQVKRYKKGSNIKNETLAAFGGRTLKYDGGIFVTTSDFTREAKKEAENFFGLELINGEQLQELRREAGM